MGKNKVYFCEFNIPMDNVVYLPFVSGILQAYAQTFEEIKEHYEFMPYIFIRDFPDNIIKQFINPSVVAFSVCIWNHQLSLKIAEMVKKRFPYCQIIFGGPQVCKDDKEKYPFIDHIILHEGEHQFVKLLGSFVGSNIETEETKDLDFSISPYSEGLYNKTLARYPEIDFQAIIETNRGCPFQCSFCYWGQGFDEKKIRFKSLKAIQKEADWICENKIKYIFIADANFGMYPQDQFVARIYARNKRDYGYPDKIRVCYGKNKEDNVFKTAKILSDAGLAKAVTLARQSNDEDVLKKIQRSNIKLDVYKNLQQRYENEGMATYTEIILGLPGETLVSFIAGVEDVIKGETQLFIYHCTILVNTEMADDAYIKKHGIKTVRVPLAEIHCKIREPGLVTEYEDIVIETNTMSKTNWMIACVYSWRIQLSHVFGVRDVPQGEITIFYDIARGITNGKARGQVDRRFGDIYWEPEELAYLRICLERGEIKNDLKEFAKKNVLYGRKKSEAKKGV